MCRGRRARTLLHLHIQREKSDLKMPLENGRADERVSRGQASKRAVCVCCSCCVRCVRRSRCVCVYYCRTYYKAVGWRGEEGDSDGRVL